MPIQMTQEEYDSDIQEAYERGLAARGVLVRPERSTSTTFCGGEPCSSPRRTCEQPQACSRRGSCVMADDEAQPVAWMHEFKDPHTGQRSREPRLNRPKDYELQPGDTVRPLVYAYGVLASETPQEFFCNKCGYFGPVEVFHERPNGSGKCDYMAVPIKPRADHQAAVRPTGDTHQ